MEKTELNSLKEALQKLIDGNDFGKESDEPKINLSFMKETLPEVKTNDEEIIPDTEDDDDDEISGLSSILRKEVDPEWIKSSGRSLEDYKKSILSRYDDDNEEEDEHLFPIEKIKKRRW